MNQCNFLGNLTRDPELKYLQSGNAVCTFGMAVNRRYKSGDETKEETVFLDCEAWGKTGETIAEYVSKGQKIVMTSRMKTDSWEHEGQKRYKNIFVVERFDFADGPKKTQETPEVETKETKTTDVPF